MARKQPHLPTTIAGYLADIQRRPEVYFPAWGKGPAGRTAQAATYLNYAPQFEALAAILGSARSERRTGIQSARRSGLAGSQGIQHIRDSYTTGLKDTLGSLGGPVATGATAASPEARAAQQLGLSGTALAGMLSSMAAQQVAGIGNTTAQLNRQFSGTRDEIGSKLTGLLGQSSAYNTQQYESLAGDQRKAKAAAAKALADRRIRLMTAGIDPDTGQHSEALDPTKPWTNRYGYTRPEWEAMTAAQRKQITSSYGSSSGNGLTPAAKRERREHYAQIRDTIQDIRKDGDRLSTVKVWFNPETGAVVQPDKNGVPPEGATQRHLTESEIQAAIDKKYPKAPPIVRRAAAEIAVDGTMSLRTLRALKRRFPKIEMPKGWVDRDGKPDKHKPAASPFDPFQW